MNHKSVPMKRHRFTNSEREYVKGIVHNMSFQRHTDQEIVQWLHDEKQIDIDRSTISKIRNKVEQNAEKWYIELRNSTYKYIAIYKERIDSLFSYQKKLHEIIHATKKDEVKIRAICELHSIEMDIFSLWKQLPQLDIVDNVKQPGEKEQKQKQEPDKFGEWYASMTDASLFDPQVDDSPESQEHHIREAISLYNNYVKNWKPPEPWTLPDTDKTEVESESWC